MIESLPIIYEGCATMIKNKVFLKAELYISPFIELTQDITEKVICNVKDADQISMFDNRPELVYNKVLITCICKPEFDFTVHSDFRKKDLTFKRVLCMTYSLDTRIPVCKFFTGVIDEYMNFFAFGEECCIGLRIEPETPIDYSPANTLISKMNNDNCKQMIEQLVNCKIKTDSIVGILGKWIDSTISCEYVNDFGKVKLATTIPVEAYKNLVIFKDSWYYVDGQETDLLTIYQSYACQFSSDEKDMINKYEKTQVINKILGL